MELMKQGAMMTVLHTLLTALAWPAALLTITDFIDSTWSIAVDRCLFVWLPFLLLFLFWRGMWIREEEVVEIISFPFLCNLKVQLF